MRLRVASLLWRSWWRPLCFSGLLLSYWMCHNGRKSNTAWLTMREWKFNSLHSVRAEHPTLYTKQKSVHLCVFAYPRVRSRCMARLPRKISHHWPIKIPLYEGEKQELTVLKAGFVAILSWRKTWKWCKTLKHLTRSKKLPLLAPPFPSCRNSLRLGALAG